MSTEGNDEASSSEQQSLSCSMTFQNAIEIDFSKLREMEKQEALDEVNATRVTGGEDESEVELDHMTEQLSASILTASTSTARVERDLSVYDRALERHDPDSSSEEDLFESGLARKDPEEEDTEVENSHSDDDEDAGTQYEQLGSTEFTKQFSEDADDDDGDGAHSDGEFGEFESCPASYQVMSSDDHDSDHHIAEGGSGQVDVEEVQLEDKTQDVLANYHPRTAASAIPPLDQDKIALIKSTMAGLKLKPLANAGRVADAVIRAKPRVGDELNHKTS